MDGRHGGSPPRAARALARRAIRHHARDELRPPRRIRWPRWRGATPGRCRSMPGIATTTTSSKASSRIWPATVARLGAAAGAGAEVKVFVDTAPVMEKPLAEAAGLGWAGKHTNLVSRHYGSWLFLGSIFTTLDLAPDPATGQHCGTCRACLDACPTQAFPAPFRLDATRCISYLTIEHAGPIAPAFRPLMGNRIYGCDDCLAACPLEQVRDRRSGSEAARARRSRGAEPRPAVAPRRCRLQDPVFGQSDQTHRGRPLPAQRADRESATPATSRSPHAPWRCSVTRRLSSAPWRSGPGDASVGTEALEAASPGRRASEVDPDVRIEWEDP